MAVKKKKAVKKKTVKKKTVVKKSTVKKKAVKKRTPKVLEIEAKPKENKQINRVLSKNVKRKRPIKPKRNYIEIAAQYADDILSGEIPACRYIKLACERFVNDLQRTDIYLDVNKAVYRCFKKEKIKHVKGKWRGELYIMSPWQVFQTVNVYGWYYKKTNKRRFTEVYSEIPRKNGKSFDQAADCAVELSEGDEPGGEIYVGATTENQAWEIFGPLKQIMINQKEEIADKYDVQIMAKQLIRRHDQAKAKPVIGKPGDGPSPSRCCIDEYHEHTTSDMYSTFDTGTLARENPIIWITTTAGFNIDYPCYAKRDLAIQVLEGLIDNDRLFVMIYTIDEGEIEKWDDVTEEILKKANPNLGVSVDFDSLKIKMQIAKPSAIDQNKFKTKHLNVWGGSKAQWLNMLWYQKRVNKHLDINDFKGLECYMAIDLADKTDFASKALHFPPQGDLTKHTFFVSNYLPEDTIVNSDQYQEWFHKGFINANTGNIIDIDSIENDVKKDHQLFDVKEMSYDKYQATQFATHMMNEGFEVIEFGQTVKNFSEPMKDFGGLIIDKNRDAIQFEYDPVLFWMFSNVIAVIDKKDNIFPDKEKTNINGGKKIDGFVASLMSYARWYYDTLEEDFDFSDGLRGVEH